MARFLLLLVLGSCAAAFPLAEEPAADPAVTKALAYLSAAQTQKGNWTLTTGRYPVAVTGLNVLAFLSAGVKTDDKTNGPVLKKAIDYLLANQDQNGLFRDPSGAPMYGHGIALWAIAEYRIASGKAAPENLKPAMEKAVALLAKVQSPQGGWRYHPVRTDADTSITSWQLLGLRAAVLAGVDVPEKVLKGGHDFLASCRRKDTGYSYTPFVTTVLPGCTAGCVLHLILSGAPTDRQDMQALRDVVLKQIAQPGQYVCYTYQYQAQVLVHFPGKEAEAGLATIREKLLKLQTERGSFDSRIGSEGFYGPNLITPLAVLALTARDQRLAVMKPEVAGGQPVARALAALTRSQGQQGDWVGPPDKPQRVASTGLALLAYLSAGVKPDDKEYGPALKKAAQFLLANQDRTGLYTEAEEKTTQMYSHGIATWALAEYLAAHAKEPPEAVKTSLGRAVDLLVRAQSDKGGWRYTPQPMDGDLSVTSWQILALRATDRAGVPVPAKTLRMAMGFVGTCKIENLGFSYFPSAGGAGVSTTAAGLLHTILAGAKTGNEEVIALRDLVLKRTPAEPGGFYFYSLFHQAQALACFDDRGATDGLAAVRQALLACKQDNGSFVSRGVEEGFGPGYNIGLAVLGLTAKERKLIVFKKPPQ